MKHMLRFTTILTLLLFFLGGNVCGQTSIWTEDFSTGSMYSVTLGAEGQDGSSDYFIRTDDNTGHNIGPSYTGINGFFFAGQDIDDSGWTGSASPSELTWTGIDISGFTNLEFDGKFASSATAEIDATDYLHVQYRVDAGTWTNLIWFENDGVTYNTAFFEDSDFSGDGEGTQLSSTFTNFNKSISVTGSNLDLRITVFVDSGDEDFAIDDFVISGTGSGPPAPTALSIDQAASDKMQITWTKPSGTYGTDWDGVVVFLTDGAGDFDINNLFDEGDNAINADGANFDVQSVDGAEYSYDGTSSVIGYCVANQSADSDGDITVSGLTDGSTYYLVAYTYKTVSGDDNDEWSNQTDGGNDVAEVPEISGFTVTPGDQQLDLSWTNPSGAVTTWWDKVIIVARQGSAVEAAISKANFDGVVDGTVTAESDWSVSPGHDNSDVYDQTAVGSDNTNYFVYNGIGAKGSATISGLSNGTAYYFKAMVYYEDGSASDVWSDGIDINGTPTNISSTGNVIISEMCDPNNDYAINRYIEITNIDNVSIDLTGWTLDAITNNGTDVDFTWALSGTIEPNESLTLGDTDNSVFTPDFAEADWSTSNTSWNGNEGDGAKLYDGSKALVDDAATPDGGSNLFENEAIIRLLSITEPVSTFNADEWYATGVLTPAESTPGYHINVWTGDTDNSWTTVGNWSQGIATKELCHALIPSTATNMPTVSSKAAGDVHDIMIEEGATLLGQENLTVNGTAFVKKSFSGYSAVDATDGWYAVSPPVNGMVIAGSDFEPVENEDDFYVYDEATNYWLNYFDNSNPATLFDEFDPVTGYLLAYHTNNDGTKSFAGTLNSSASYAPSLSNTNTAWNLVGNPYCSYVTWADVSNTDVSSPKVLNATTGAWDDLGTTVEAAQGIFVYAESGSASLTFETADQTHGSTKKSGEYPGYVKLLAGFDDDLTVQLLIQTNENATQNYEWQHDARYFYPVTSIPYLCAVTKDNVWVSKYVFDSGAETTIIPVRLKVQEEQQITFSIENFETNFGISKLTLEDTKLNTFTVLSEDKTYIFDATPDDDPFRFKLHAEAGTGIHEATIEGLSIYTHHNILYLNSSEVRDASVKIFNVTGQQVYDQQVVMDGLTQINPNLKTGWFVVKVTTTKGMASTKVFIK